jgi:hypothetical protein
VPILPLMLPIACSCGTDFWCFQFLGGRIIFSGWTTPSVFPDNLGCRILKGKISSGNQLLHTNYENFNISYMILIQWRAHGRWKERFTKFMGGERGDLQRCFCKLLLPPPLNAPLDQYHVARIEVSIVCTERLVST